MKRIAIITALVLALVGTYAAGYRDGRAALGLGAKAISRNTEECAANADYILLDNPRGEIEKFFCISKRECGQFRHGDAGCIRNQFDANYHWYVLKDVNPAAGPPGVPGPIIPADEATRPPQ